MDKNEMLRNAKELARQNLNDDLRMLDQIDSLDQLAVLMFGSSYSCLAGFRVIKKYVGDANRVATICKEIQDQYSEKFKGSE